MKTIDSKRNKLCRRKYDEYEPPPITPQAPNYRASHSVNLSPGFKNEFYPLQRGFRSFVNSRGFHVDFAWILTSVSYKQLVN